MTSRAKDRDTIILTLNGGSSSLKFGVYSARASGIELVFSGQAQAIGEPAAMFKAIDRAGKSLLEDSGAIATYGEAMRRIETVLKAQGVGAPDVVGHRIVHGGPALTRHCRVDETVIRTIEGAALYAPLHTPVALEILQFATSHFPDALPVACLDTAFHAAMPAVASTLPVAKALKADGIRRYGFHGLSCESILDQLGKDRPERLIIAHLGNGASVTAVRNGCSVDTSMGLTPAGGIIMGTRSGDLDPGLLLYLMRAKQYDAAALEDLLDHHSGLSGISGRGNDMRALHEAAASDPDAALAIAMFSISVGKSIAGMITMLGGLDMIVFTGGIGENDAVVRAQICDRLAWFGITLDAGSNAAGANPLSTPESKVHVHVLPSREDDQIARHAYDFFGRTKARVEKNHGQA